MRKVVLMVAFGFGATLLLPRPASSLDDCTACTCKQMKAWVFVSENPQIVHGLRMQDPTDPKKYIAVEHVPVPSDVGGRLLSTAADPGSRTSQGVNYAHCKYTKTPDLDCKVGATESGHSVVRVTFANAGDWEFYQVYLNESFTQHLCAKSEQ